MSRGRDYTKNVSEKNLIGNIGFGGPAEADRQAKRKVLITGAGSYIGESFTKYAKMHYPDNLVTDAIDMRDGSWREKDFSEYDIVYHVAGIAHADVSSVSDEIKEMYYAVNTDLALETAEKAKRDGVKEFVFMSSMIVYGESAPYGKKKVIDECTVPMPVNFYGDSKLQADVSVRALADEKFKVAVLRPPMIYGKGSKGNYPTLAKLAKKLPVFPNVNNERSMLYIENLCEFLCQLFLVDIASFDSKGNVFLPQNAEYTRTSDMVGLIAAVTGHSIVKTGLLNPAVMLAGKMPGKVSKLVNKAFGNICYKQSISVYAGIEYRVVGLSESVERTETRFDTDIYSGL